MTDMIIEATELSRDILDKLISNEVYVVRIPNYTSTAILDKMKEFVRTQATSDYYHELWEQGVPKMKSYGVHRIGPSLNTTYGTLPDSQEYNSYFEQATKTSITLRSIIGKDYLLPIDRLRLELDDLYGCYVPNVRGRRLYSGIIRVMVGGDINAKELEEQPHIDEVPTNLLDIDSQYSANIYLEVPSSGGELLLWDVEPGLNSTLDDSKMYTIKPVEGELILINTQRYHAVKTFESGYRISAQTFIGYKEGQPLIVWN